MKIILTESQYELLEMINEIVSAGFTKEIEKGGFVTVSRMLDEKEEISIIEITDIHGNGQFIEGKNSSGVYLFDLSLALSTTDNTFTGLRYGKYIPPQKNEEGKIISAPQIVGGSKMSLKNVIKVVINNSSKQPVDTILTDMGKVEKAKLDKENEPTQDVDLDDEGDYNVDGEDQAEERDVLKIIMNDPTMRKLMYHQPSILGGLIKVGKAKGIAAVSNIINRNKEKEAGKTPKTFLKNKYYEFETLIPISVTHGLKVFKLFVGEWYNAQYDGVTFNGHAGERENKVSYTIKLQKKNEDGTYRGLLSVKFLEKGTDKNSPNRIETKRETISIRIKNKG